MSSSIPTYESIGVRPLINCKGTLTIVSGSLLLPEARQAMSEASGAYVQMEELMERVGTRIGELMHAEFGLVTCGCAAALCQVTAASVVGTTPEGIKQLPDTTGMRNEVMTLKSHRHVYDHAIRMVGVKLVEVGSHEEMKAAMNENTAMVAIFGDAADRGEISVANMVSTAHAHNIPVLVDAAAERPDTPNVYLEEGVDAVAYSGGKCLRGPQASGLVLGRKDLLWDAYMNGAPHHAIGRPMKAGKEEIMGLLAAVEQWAQRDHEAEWKTWEGWLQTITNAVSDFPTIETSIQQPGRSNVAPVLQINWDQAGIPIPAEEIVKRLSDGEPRIEVGGGGTSVSVMPYMMEEGEADVVADRLREELSAAV